MEPFILGGFMFRFLVGLTMFMAFAFPALAQGKGHAAFVAAAKEMLTQDFKDPAGARYRNTAVYRQIDGVSLSFCGEVNAKNSYGAYVGFVPFYADDSRGTLKEDAEDTLFDTLSKAYCYKRIASVK